MLMGFGPHSSELLTIELVPESSWGDNLRSRLKKADWDILRRAQYKAAGYHCEICGGKGRRHPVEGHEVWDYNDQTYTQTLTRLIALCPACHLVKHFGFACLQGRELQALDHLMRVNKWTKAQADVHIEAAFELHAKRSLHRWTLDLTWLATQGIAIPEDPDGFSLV